MVVNWIVLGLLVRRSVYRAWAIVALSYVLTALAVGDRARGGVVRGDAVRFVCYYDSHHATHRDVLDLFSHGICIRVLEQWRGTS